jgi:hypothetical protein
VSLVLVAVATSLVHVSSHFILRHEIIFTQGERCERTCASVSELFTF